MLTLADHLLVAVIVLGLPLRAWFGMRRLREAALPDLPVLRPRLWWRAIASQWLLCLLVLLLWRLTYRSPASLGLVLRPTPGLLGVLVGLGTIASLVLRQRGALATDEPLRARVRERLSSVERLLPRRGDSFAAFATLSVTAGVCEEFLFRGFLLWYALHLMPLPFAWAAQALAFGLGHAYQGPRGILLTGLAGAFFSAVVWVTGSLWPAMLIHALMDLNAGDMARKVFAPDAPDGSHT